MTCFGYLATKTFGPKNFYKVTWDLIIGFIYMFCYILDPFIISFKYIPIYDPLLNRFQRTMSFFLIFNMILVPFSAKLKKQEILGEYTGKDSNVRMKYNKDIRFRLDSRMKENEDHMDHELERDPGVLLKKYLKEGFFLDFFANVPICFFEMLKGYPLSEEDLASLAQDTIFKLFMCLKLLRFFRIK